MLSDHAARLARVIAALERDGIRPRIQDAWRSPEDQLKAFNEGHSKLKLGFRNVTGAQGQKQTLAVDLLDESSPIAPTSEYVMRLAAAARAEGLQTGVAWGLPAKLRTGLEAAIEAGDFKAQVRIGWDPCHMEPTGISPAEARQGKRPD